MIHRRIFLKQSGIALFGLGLVPSFIYRTAVASQAAGRKRVLVVLFQRGGADGLNIVVPFAEKEYYRRRPSIALPPPSAKEGAVLDLDGFFGLHPALEPLLPLYREGHLAVVHAVGSPHSTRSHFDAQDFMESGVPGDKSVPDGWMNRYLQHRPDPQATAFRGVALSAVLPRSLAGKAPAIALSNLSRFELNAGGATSQARSAYQLLYSREADALLSGTASEMFEAIDFLHKANPTQYRPSAGVEYPRGRVGQDLQQVAQLIKADVGLEVAFVEMGGWDHHVNEGGATGPLAAQLAQLAQALSAFYRDLGSRMEEVVVATVSEFGRTVHENGNRGTDHGHGNLMLVLGGTVRGGRILGDWPGLDPDQLYEGRDLALTTDFRSIFGELLTRHLGCREIEAVFPGFKLDEGSFKEVL